MTRRGALAWFLLSFLVFNLNLRPINCGDTLPAELLPFSILLDHQLSLDRFYYPYYSENAVSGYMFHPTEGHAYSLFPISLPIILTPLYAPVVALLRVGD